MRLPMLISFAVVLSVVNAGNAKPATEYVRIESIDDFGVLQGSCTDGDYVYAVLENPKIPTDDGFGSEGMIVKLKDSEIVKVSSALPLDHGNDLTYSPSMDKLLCVNNTGHPDRITLVDPDSLEVTGDISLGFGAYGVAYSPELNLYAVGISNSYDFAVLDGNFRVVARHSYERTGSVKQGMCCDADGIYLVQSNPNILVSFGWDGSYNGRAEIADDREVESIFVKDGEFYVGFYEGKDNGGTIARLCESSSM